LQVNTIPVRGRLTDFDLLVDFPGETFFLTEDAAAIGLAVQTEFFGFFNPFLPARSKILIEKRELETLRNMEADLFDPVMFLKTAVKEGGREEIKASGLGLPGRGLQTDFITGSTTLRPPGPGLIQKKFQIILIIIINLQPTNPGIFFQGFPPFLVFPVGMDIGIIKITADLNSLMAQGLQRIDGAGGTTDVEE
jgi:hypothetical protein